jgi:hypothetical protein
LNQNLYYHTENISSLDNYHRLFSAATDQRVIGEVSPSYLFYPKVAERLYKFNPESKIIILLRDPVARAISHYSMDRRLGYVNLDLSDIIKKKNQSSKLKLYYQQYIELGMYTKQVKSYLDIFPQEQVQIFDFDQLRQNPKVMMMQISNFLDIDPNFDYPVDIVHNPNISPRFSFINFLFQQPKMRKLVKTIINPEWINKLKPLLFNNKLKHNISLDLKFALWNIFKDDVTELKSLLNLDLSHWEMK